MSYELGRRPLVAHLEAGLRSFDRTMPEEINRLVTDSLADILWTPSPDGNENLEREGVPEHKVVRVGNIMIDSLEMLREKIEAQAAFSEFGLEPKQYGLVTLHRPGNVDNPEILKSLCELLCRVADRAPLLFPVHPRTRKSLEQNGLMKIIERQPKILLTEPLGYIRFMNLVFNCRLAITDSGGIQEETSYLGIPCLTLRENTERPITITQGTNQLCGLHDLEAKVAQVLNDPPPATKKIELWDGKTAERIVNLLRKMI
jgi:UDP-N-acetylglucosamine 2-epimerase (non-hydrolysing)